MRFPRSSPRRGLAAGLTAFVAFASAAVAMTAGAPSSATTRTPAAQAIVATAGSADGDRRDDERSADGGRHHR